MEDVEDYYKIVIKSEMEGIRAEDLQRRLRDYYLTREKLRFTKKTIMSRDMIERIERKIRDNDLHIEVYEEELEPEIIERARRSAGIDKNEEKDSSEREI